MAGHEEAVAPLQRKRIATYGKAVRKRVPEQSFVRFRQSPSPEKKITPITSRSSSRAPSEPMRLKSPKKRPSPTVAPSAKADVFEVPSSDDEALSPISPEPVRLKSPKKRPSPSAIPPTKSDVFDVPSSDDEIPTPAAPKARKPAPKATTKSKVQKSGTNKATSIEEAGRRKRVKLSPAVAQVEKTVPARAQIKITLPSRKRLQKSIELGETKVIASRPKTSSIVPRDPERLQTPRKPSFSPKDAVSCTPPLEQVDTDMMDVDTLSRHISPRGQQIWKEVLESVDNDEADGLAATTTSKAPNELLFKAGGVSKHLQRSPRKLPRRRLIDSLVEQVIYDDEMEEDQLDSDNSDTILAPVLDSLNGVELPRGQSLVPELVIPTASSSSQGPQTQNTGPKFTYSKQRSMLAEADLMAQLALDMPTRPVQAPNGTRARRGSIPKLVPLQSFHEEEEEVEGSSQTIRSVHELRQAGANNRFMDEIEDLLDRVGKPSPKPSSTRRSALLELASKFKDKHFARQFRANGVEQRLFLHLGQETDSITGFIMISILLALLVDTSMPHIITQLRRHGITRLLIRLVELSTNIVALSKERKNNISRMAQSLIGQHQDFILQMPIWEDLQPQVISPRTMALKCLEVMVRQTRESGNSSDIISKELTTNLFAILKTVSEGDSWDFPQGGQAIDFYLALSALESHSITARTVNDEAIWLSDYLPIIADNLEVALNRPVHNFGNMQTLILRLTLNVTNNNPKASDVFARKSLMAVMGGVIVAKFRKLLRFLTEEDFSLVVDHLVLVLGLMINFADGSLPARESIEALQGNSNDPLESMVQLFVDNVARTSEAESLEESQKNVAFGYLAVLLGYLSLSPVLAKRIAAQQPRGTLRPIVASIEEFIGHHKAADSQFQADDDGYSANTGLTERLESLVVRLRATKSAGL